MNEPTHLDLFSGIGGFALAAQWAGFRTIAFCEIDKYCQKVLAKHFLADADGSGSCFANGTENSTTKSDYGSPSIGCQDRKFTSPRSTNVRIFSDIRDLDGRDFIGVDLITGGFPCQPFSCAGKRRGKEDDRHLWPEMLRVIKEARPAWVLGENVPGIIPMELDNVLSDLESIGYAIRPFVIPACAVDARHRRDRLWIIGRNVPDPPSTRLGHEPENGLRESDTAQHRELNGTDTKGEHCSWLPEPDVGRVAHGIPSRVDRLKGLGNAIVPQVAYEILKEIRKMIDDRNPNCLL